MRSLSENGIELTIELKPRQVLFISLTGNYFWL